MAIQVDSNRVQHARKPDIRDIRLPAPQERLVVVADAGRILQAGDGGPGGEGLERVGGVALVGDDGGVADVDEGFPVLGREDTVPEVKGGEVGRGVGEGGDWPVERVMGCWLDVEGLSWMFTLFLLS